MCGKPLYTSITIHGERRTSRVPAFPLSHSASHEFVPDVVRSLAAVASGCVSRFALTVKARVVAKAGVLQDQLHDARQQRLQGSHVLFDRLHRSRQRADEAVTACSSHRA